MIKLDHLRCFTTAVREGSFAEAGKRLHLSPSAVAYGVEMLESRLGTTLLFRKAASGVSITSDGSRLLPRAEFLLQELAETEELFLARERTLSGELIVGCQEGLSWSLVPRAIQRISVRHPAVTVTQKTVFMDEGNSPILSGAVDVLITFAVNPSLDPRVHTEALCEARSYALMRADHPLTRIGDNVTLADLARYPHVFILDGPAWDYLTGLYHEKGLTPAFDKVSNISTSAQAIVGRSDSVSLRIVKPAHDQSPLGDRLAFVPISDATRNATIVAAWPKSRNGLPSAKVDAFVSECRALFDDQSMRNHLFYS